MTSNVQNSYVLSMAMITLSGLLDAYRTDPTPETKAAVVRYLATIMSIVGVREGMSFLMTLAAEIEGSR